MSKIYQSFVEAKLKSKKLLAVLIDPEKVVLENLPFFLNKLNASITTHIFVGGSTGEQYKTAKVVEVIKQFTNLPIILFPGDFSQITHKADGILFLSLISGRNPEYLINQHIKAIPILKESNLEVISTGYILVNGGVETAVQRVSKTQPISQNNIELIVNTALAGEFSGKKLIYLEAGSGATVPVASSIITSVKKELDIPLIVGGGIRTKQQLENAYNSGADLVVIGTAFEKNELFLSELKK